MSDVEKTSDYVNTALARKLMEIRKAMPYFQKKAQGYGYQYVAGCAVLETFREAADKNGVLLITSIQGSKITETKVVNDRNMEKMGRIVDLDLEFMFVDVESGEVLRVPFKAYGEQTDSSKAFGSALTYAERYFLLKFFNVPTDKDDPDAKGYPTKEPEKEEGEPMPDTKKPSLKEEGNDLIEFYFINEREHAKWIKSRDKEDSVKKGVEYLREKIKLGQALEFRFYSELMTGKEEIGRDEAKRKAMKRIEKEFTPLTLDEAKEKFMEG